jgi:CheY-like chemotaxis protein
MSCKKILLVDDDPVFVKALSMRLQSEGYEVNTAADGASTVTALHDGKPDLVVLDICFPPDVAHGGVVSWNGFDIMKWLQRMGGVTNTPVLLVTATASPDYPERARKAGAAGLIQKTADPAEILKAIQQLLP